MMTLPDKFEFRVEGHTGYTHTAKRINDWQYHIKWARGWYKVTEIQWDVLPYFDVEGFVSRAKWIIVEDEKTASDGLPDEFHIVTQLKNKFRCVRTEKGFDFYNSLGHRTEDSPISSSFINDAVRLGSWRIVERTPLTAEQKRFNLEYREQIAALESSIKLNEQDIEHKKRLIGNYQERIEVLKGKIVEGDE